MVRVAIQKYEKSGIAISPSTALQLLLEDNILPYAERFDVVK